MYERLLVWDVTVYSAALSWCVLYGLSCIFKECADSLIILKTSLCHVYFVQCKLLSEGWTSKNWGIKVEYYHVYVHLKTWVNHETSVIEWTTKCNSLKTWTNSILTLFVLNDLLW